jgi:hypothetical protein
MKTIHKYPIPVTDYVEIEMPGNAIIRHVGEQSGHICIWAEVNLDTTHEPMYGWKDVGISVYGTGHNIENHDEYIGTVQMSDGLVWHVYVDR